MSEFNEKDIISEKDLILKKMENWSMADVSIIAIDDFGNDIIDEFLAIEKTRHTKEKIDIYKEKTEKVQFVKYENGEFNKILFKPEWHPFIIIIGQKKNDIAKDIIVKYKDKEDVRFKKINIVEIYEENVDTPNAKLITSNKEEIIDFLRIITYKTASDTFLSEDNLGDIIEWLYYDELSNQNLKIKKYVVNYSDFKNDNLNINVGEFNKNVYALEVACKKEYVLALYNDGLEKLLNDILKEKDFILGFHDSLNIEEIELYFLELRQ